MALLSKRRSEIEADADAAFDPEPIQFMTPTIGNGNSPFKQVAFETDRIAKFDPSLIVSDSRLSAVLAARGYPLEGITGPALMTRGLSVPSGTHLRQ